jgi:inner membrane protein
VSPLTHLFTSWVIAAKATDHPRDCRLVAWAGILPDVDELGLLLDIIGPMLGGRQTHFYHQYHHYLLHGVFGAIAITLLLTLFASRRWRVAMLALLVFHLHLFCDFIGSRGPSPEDLWPIFYFGPFAKDPMWIWQGQWRLDGWQNKLVFLAVFVWSLKLSLARGDSVVGVFHRRADAVVVSVLRGWHKAMGRCFRPHTPKT